MPRQGSRIHLRFGPTGDVEEFWVRAPNDEDARPGWRALMLAPTLEICHALLAGEPVPLSQLRPEWVERFGLRGSRS